MSVRSDFDAGNNAGTNVNLNGNSNGNGNGRSSSTNGLRNNQPITNPFGLNRRNGTNPINPPVSGNDTTGNARKSTGGLNPSSNMRPGDKEVTHGVFSENRADGS